MKELIKIKIYINNILVIQSGYEIRVGNNPFGSHYDLYVYSQIINALLDFDISYQDIQKIQTSWSVFLGWLSKLISLRKGKML